MENITDNEKRLLRHLLEREIKSFGESSPLIKLEYEDILNKLK
ncbi:hypothetical protein BMS3Abin17_00620 [archaeon BMS3Abin17]|nr:hypothetical protein BMS3Abin17_00620 [archaeon BMS3Abin17]